ncbi:MAG: hypothetical protein AABY86_07310 [Bdellovibrionota bacterium]
MTLRLAANTHTLNQENISNKLLKNYHDLFEIVTEEKSVSLIVEFCTLAELELTSGSGKLKHVIDRRQI